MSPASATTGRLKQAHVAIAGNPNTGKTTLFNRLTGGENKVGNYPGVTVERHVGVFQLPSGAEVDIADVPGAYSLSARSSEEQLALKVVAGIEPYETPDVIVLVVDATQLSRNLYLVLQVIELGVPTIVALNMIDVLEKRGEAVDVRAMEAELGVPVIETCALRGVGVNELRLMIERVLSGQRSASPGWRWQPDSAALIEDVEQVVEALPRSWRGESVARDRALALWALLSLDEHDEFEGVPRELRARVDERRSIAAHQGRNLDVEIIQGRYGWIDARIARFVREAPPEERHASERIDAVLLNPWLGFPIFLVIMGVVFQALFSWADPAITAIEQWVALIADGVRSLVPEGLLLEFLTKGLIAGIGSIIVFLPQILLLFFFIGLMEDTGYMARVAFLMDRIMRSMGLHGRAFVPMLSGYACAVPAILATRTMERQRDRTLTMMVIPLMTCSARLPVYALVIGALFPPLTVLGLFPVQGLLMVGMYLFSTLTALIAASVLSRTLFKGPRVPLILELPPYRPPHWGSVLRMMWQKTRSFLQAAGSIILVCTIVLWLLLSFPKDARGAERAATERALIESLRLTDEERTSRLSEVEAERSAEAMRMSYGGRLGRSFEPLISPLGFDWKVGIGLLGAFAAREVFVSTMGVVYGVGESADETSTTLRERIRAESRTDGRRIYTPLMGLSLMVFFALACQCISTLAAVYRETRTWRWPVFLFLYTLVLAWTASFVVYQGGRLLGFEH